MTSSFTAWVFTRRKFIFIAMVVPSIFIVYYVREVAMNEVLNCIVMNREPIDSRFLENIFKAKHKPKYNGKSIFFLETHIDKNITVFLTPRQACSIESAGDNKLFKKFLDFTIVCFSHHKSRPRSVPYFCENSWIL